MIRDESGVVIIMAPAAAAVIAVTVAGGATTAVVVITAAVFRVFERVGFGLFLATDGAAAADVETTAVTVSLADAFRLGTISRRAYSGRRFDAMR